jgi:hypothetical protein
MPIMTYDQFDVLYKNISSNRGCTVGHFPIWVQASFFRQKLEKLTQIRFIRDENINKHKKLLRLRPNLMALGDIYSIRLSVFVDK